MAEPEAMSPIEIATANDILRNFTMLHSPPLNTGVCCVHPLDYRLEPYHIFICICPLSEQSFVCRGQAS